MDFHLFRHLVGNQLDIAHSVRWFMFNETSPIMKFIIPLFLVCFLISCDHGPVNFEGGDPNREGEIRTARMMVPPPKQAESQSERKLIKTGSLSLTVANVSATSKEIHMLCAQYHAYVSSETQTRYDQRLEYDQVIRIPAANFDGFIARVEALGKEIGNKNIETSDVTEEFIDKEARLKTKRELESRYREILKQAKEVSDILSIEAQLNNVRSDIESMEGRLKFLNSQVSYSTLTLSFHERIGVESGFGSKTIAAFGHGWDAFLVLIIALVNLWPFLLIAAIAIIAVGKFKLRRLKTVPRPSE
jgi:hypothetical protein